MTERRALPLSARLAATYVLLVGAALLVVAGLVIQLTRSHLEGSLDRRLSSAAASFQDGPARRVADASDLAVEARRWLAIHGFTAEELAAVRAPEGEVLTAASGLDPRDIEGGAELLRAGDARWWDLRSDDRAIRALTVPLLLEGRQIGTLVVGASRSEIDETLRALLVGTGWASGAGLALAALLGFVAVRRTLRPLRRIAGEVDAIQATGDLSRRVSGEGPADEVGRLAAGFDRMLERLQESFDSQRRFLSDASHELRTPLTVIRGQLELLQGQIGSAQGRRSVAGAVEELDRMRRIVDDLLLLARLDEGLALSREPVEVDLVAEEALLRGMAGERRDASVEIEPGLRALADPERLLQVLTNLVANAVRHAGEEARLTIRARRSPVAVVIEVADSGRGIPPDDLPHVFERLYRGGSPGRQGGGAGLGLAIADSLVRAMGGTVSVESSDGAGTTFRILLPGADVPEGVALARPAP